MESMETTDSRKRPLDGDFESGVSKRSNQGLGNCVHLKILVPSIAAGAIIGKGGETITQIQKETGAVIKMSKANDYYPGTTERVCLMTGTIESVKNVHEFILSKIREKPDPNPKADVGDLKVKILVPNSTAGMIIGKGGNYIRQIKDESGAYVQISQKSKDLNLPERCVTIAGDEEQNKKAVDMILQKVVEDPQSGSCPNISYADVQGPVASSNPTGSPFATSASNGNFGNNFMGNPNISSNIAGLNNLNLNSSSRIGSGGVGNTGAGSAMDTLKATLRGSGYTEQAVEEISNAMYTLANYGLLGVGFGLNNQSSVNLGGTTGLGGLSLGSQLSNLGSLLTGGTNNGNGGGGGLLGGGSGAGGGGGGGGGGNLSGSMFGPVGSGPSGMSGDGSNNSSLFGSHSMASGEQFGGSGGETMFDASYGAGYSGPNQNSFGLGTSIGGFSPKDDGGKPCSNKKEMEVAENIVGAILGPGGKGIVDLQQFTGANIQISKKGIYAPGTRNRVVTITGNPSSVSRANYLIQQRINQEESKRARQAAAR